MKRGAAPCNRFTSFISIPRSSVPKLLPFHSLSLLTSPPPLVSFPKGSMAAARTAFSRVAPAIANVRARPSLALKRAAFARGYATASENSVGVARHSHVS